MSILNITINPKPWIPYLAIKNFKLLDHQYQQSILFHSLKIIPFAQFSSSISAFLNMHISEVKDEIL